MLSAGFKQILLKFEYPEHFRSPTKALFSAIVGIPSESWYSRQQLTRLIQQYSPEPVPGDSRRLAHRSGLCSSLHSGGYSSLLAAMDTRHDSPQWPGRFKKLCERAWQLFGEAEYERLAAISSRTSVQPDRKCATSTGNSRRVVKKTRPSSLNYWLSMSPACVAFPGGQPGSSPYRYRAVKAIAVINRKGCYHINAVDEVTQFQVVCTVEKIT